MTAGVFGLGYLAVGMAVVCVLVLVLEDGNIVNTDTSRCDSWGLWSGVSGCWDGRGVCPSSGTRRW